MKPILLSLFIFAFFAGVPYASQAAIDPTPPIEELDLASDADTDEGEEQEMMLADDEGANTIDGNIPAQDDAAATDSMDADAVVVSGDQATMDPIIDNSLEGVDEELAVTPQDSLEQEDPIEGEVDGGFPLAATFAPSVLKAGDVGEITVTLENLSGANKDYVVYMFLEDEGENFTSNDNYFVDQSIAAGDSKSYTFSWLNNEKPGTYTLWAEVKNADWSGDSDNAEHCICLHKQVVGQITVEPGGSEETGSSLYRFWSENFRGHFFTTSLNEAEGLKSDSNWAYEGTLSQKTVNRDLLTDAQARDLNIKPVYRFWNAGFKHHFYTISETEKDRLIESDPNWAYESVAYYTYGERKMDTTAVHRFWSPSYKGHFFTASETEKDSIIEKDPNWVYEGIAWYMQK